MSNFTDQLILDAAGMTSADEFGTAISVTPYGLSARTINVVVTYGIPSTIPESGRTVSREATIEFRNHATLGMTSVNISGDKFRFPDKIGGSDRDCHAGLGKL